MTKSTATNDSLARAYGKLLYNKASSLGAK